MKILKNAWKVWRKFARVVGNFQARIIFTLFYFLILWIIGLVSTYVADPLQIKKRNNKTNFSAWDYPNETLQTAQNPY